MTDHEPAGGHQPDPPEPDTTGSDAGPVVDAMGPVPEGVGAARDGLPVDAAPGGARRARGHLTSLSRTQVLGVIYVLIGAWFSAGIARVLDPASVALAVGVGPDAPAIPFRPVGFTIMCGVAFALAGALALAEAKVGRWGTRALLVATALLAPLVLVLALAGSPGSRLNMVPLLVEALRLGTPVALGALAGLFAERSGVVNIGIEGMMLAGAGVGFVIYAVLGASGGLALPIAVVVAVAIGGLMAALHAVLTITFRADQIVSGVVVNLLALGITSFLRREILLPMGIGGTATLPTIDLPLLSQIPVLGPAVFSGKPIFLSMFVIFVVTQVVLFRTRWGLRVRSVGEQPHAAETLGINVIRLRYQSVIIGGLIAGLAGAWFSLETVGSFGDGMTGGKGFIALAALIFGKWRPWPAFGGAMLFGFAEALGRRIQLMDVTVGGYPIPSPWLQALPFIVTIVVLAGAIGRAVPPASVGVPYQRER